MDIKILFDLAILIFAAKALGLLARRIGAPQVVGEILAGLIVGPSVINLIQVNDAIEVFAEIGVIMLMFAAGLGTDLKQLKSSGFKAFLVALIGVLVPLAGGFALYGIFYGFAAPPSKEFYTALFMGTIITATSVSITVAALSEMGKLSTQVGTTIVGAAVIDDVIGIIVLTCVIGGCGGEGNVGLVLLKIVLFFLIAFVIGFVIYKAMEWLDARHPHTQRIPIYSLAFCLAMAYVAQRYFEIADITGAYCAGIALCTLKDTKYVEKRIDISSYMLFGPIFFACIGLKTDLSGLTLSILGFSICFIITALVTKVIGCGLAAKICGYDMTDSLRIGAGMMTRGEVALIVAQKGLSAGVLDSTYFPAVILLIIVSSVITPVVLKLLFSKGKQAV
ncbi:MAG: cation:proton antiporter [Lachnospiraceae bacterium]|nr:cation:proton antiporter [Lachnospiraceae bacterium]